MNTIKQKFKKLRLILENYIYKKRYERKFGTIPQLSNFVISKNKFSKKKMKIIYLTSYDSTFSINNTYKPLQEFGKVFRFEMNETYGDKKWYPTKNKINRQMIEFIKKIMNEHKIDIIVCYLSGRTLSHETLNFFTTLNVPIINEALDDERKFKNHIGKDGLHKGNKDVCKYFTLNLTTSKSALIKYIVEGGKVMYKPYAGNPKEYKKLNLTKKYDVVFIGAKYGTRPFYIDYLKQNNINVLAKGEDWEAGIATPEEMIELFNRAKIILGFAGVGINDDIMILKGRDFEAPLTGSLYMTQYHDELKEYFELGVDIETYKNKEELLEKVKFYLSCDEKREKIAQNGYEKCLQNYTAKKSYEKIFGYLGL
ncbi:putative protein, putative glycosyltransferase [Campylobacter iguaniorum]|uniref:glycosyltransferase family protein n=1 Tax=Campylobacter iguaniorum TaxID=1244531 RepID=UPI00073A19CF|nr:glycosyltransferase [Campylobacter iguaniorum]ALV25157.1 putative protein, putative glycosyltransferase [Campylobacter iguaniorum]